MTKDKYTQFTTTAQVNEAFSYLLEPKKSRKTNPFLCLGRNPETREVLRRIQMPALPLLESNKELREQMKPREKSPLFRVVAGAIAAKASDLSKEVTRAIREERQKKSIDILYRLEPPKDGEFIDENPLTVEEFKATLVDEK